MTEAVRAQAMPKFKMSLLILLVFFPVMFAEANPPNGDDRALMKWAHSMLRPLFLSDDPEKIKASVSKEAHKDILKLKRSIDIIRFGKIELEQKATIDGVPAWRIVVHVRAKNIESNETLDYALQLLILKNKSGKFRVNHIDTYEQKLIVPKK